MKKCWPVLAVSTPSLTAVLAALDMATGRVASLEQEVSLLGHEIAGFREDFIGFEHRLDGVDQRLHRIWKRLALAER